MKSITGVLFGFGALAIVVFVVSVKVFSDMNNQQQGEQVVQGVSDVQPSPTGIQTEASISGSQTGFGDLNPTSTPVPTATPTIKPFTTPPPMTIDKNRKYSAMIKTSKGDMTVELYADKTPITVNNFVFLARNKFYEGTKFHRIIKGFMIQGGDAPGNKVGGIQYSFNDEPVVGEYTRGTLAMANAGPNTNASQFFIMHQDMGLPKSYVIFGKVTGGLETLDAIADTPVKANAGGEQSQPIEEVMIKAVEITEQ